MRLATKGTETENLFETLANKSPVGVYIVQDGKFCYTNPAFQSTTGYRGDELLGRDALGLVVPEDRERVRENAIKMLKGKLTLPYEFRVIHKTGNIRWITESVSSIQYRGRRATLANFMDITDRKQAEDALRESREKFQKMFESVTDGISVIDLKGVIIETNPATAEMHGFASKDELVGRNAIELVASRDHRRITENVRKAVKEGTIRGVEYTLLKADGTEFPAELSTSVVRDASGKVAAHITIARDITERKKAEEALKLAAEEWRNTFDSITDAISIHDREFRILRANKAFADIFSMEPHQIIGKHCYELHKGEKPRTGCPYKQTLATGKPAMTESYEPHLGKYLLESTSPIFNEQGEVIGTVHITRDITEQKRQSERLMMADRLASIGELAAGAAHELNNPLTSIIGFSQLLMEKDIPDDIREDVKFIYDEAQRAANVTKNLLTFARKHTPMKQLTQINNIIEDVLKLRAYGQKVNSIEVKKCLDPDLPEILVDYSQMQQVFLNIIINAEYFMIEAHKKGTLTITTKKQNNKVMISIADDGSGIPPENLNRIFDPFFTTKEAGKGTGLGLSICHGIVAEHGGQIYARSELGKGATIFIELPINDSDHIESML